MKNFVKILGLTLFMVSTLLLSSGCFTGNAASKETAEKFPAFKTVDTNGNAVTEDIFKGKKVTVVNIWGTFCPPCIEEMPKDAQIIGIVCDSKGASDTKTTAAAVKIMNDAGVKFVNILPDEGIGKYLDNVMAVPTTIFVDGE
ncbi:MAG: TlpA family protein disulfide reductase, partial [Selenomonadaceae bacterium]|nr:TlpA family protein disulfide reductase [Selenomonadaceae bacterium]